MRKPQQKYCNPEILKYRNKEETEAVTIPGWGTGNGVSNRGAKMCNHAVITQLTEALAHAIVARLGGFLHSRPELWKTV